MERTAYARLYATVTGTVLVLLGFGGLLANTEFRAPELTSDLLGFYTVNGWANVFHVAAGLAGLLLARPLPRLYALVGAVLFTGLGLWGILAPDGTLLLGELPATRWVNLINLLFGLAGLSAYVASRWDRIRTRARTLRARLEAGAEARRQKRRRRRIRRRRQASEKRRRTGSGRRRPAPRGGGKPRSGKA